MGSFILKRKIYSSFSKALPGIQEIENFPYIDKDNCTVVNDHNLQVDKNAIANIIELFKNPEKYIIPAIYDYEKSFSQGRSLKESDYKDTYCCKIEVIEAKGIEFYVRPIPGTKLYKVYGPQFIWLMSAYLGTTSPVATVIEGNWKGIVL
jgi:hypothetical protein